MGHCAFEGRGHAGTVPVFDGSDLGGAPGVLALPSDERSQKGRDFLKKVVMARVVNPKTDEDQRRRRHSTRAAWRWAYTCAKFFQRKGPRHLDGCVARVGAREGKWKVVQGHGITPVRIGEHRGV